jgi:hypothetical protein
MTDVERLDPSGDHEDDLVSSSPTAVHVWLVIASLLLAADLRTTT